MKGFGKLKDGLGKAGKLAKVAGGAVSDAAGAVKKAASSISDSSKIFEPVFVGMCEQMKKLEADSGVQDDGAWDKVMAAGKEVFSEKFFNDLADTKDQRVAKITDELKASNTPLTPEPKTITSLKSNAAIFRACAIFFAAEGASKLKAFTDIIRIAGGSGITVTAEDKAADLLKQLDAGIEDPKLSARNAQPNTTTAGALDLKAFKVEDVIKPQPGEQLGDAKYVGRIKTNFFTHIGELTGAGSPKAATLMTRIEPLGKALPQKVSGAPDNIYEADITKILTTAKSVFELPALTESEEQIDDMYYGDEYGNKCSTAFTNHADIKILGAIGVNIEDPTYSLHRDGVSAEAYKGQFESEVNNEITRALGGTSGGGHDDNFGGSHRRRRR